jgi:hypothetical protein
MASLEGESIYFMGQSGMMEMENEGRSTSRMERERAKEHFKRFLNEFALNGQNKYRDQLRSNFKMKKIRASRRHSKNHAALC